jgi:hypothetical protein
MAIKNICWLFLAIVAAEIVWFPLGGMETIGLSEHWTNDSYMLAAGTHPIALVCAIITALLYMWLMVIPRPNIGRPMPSLFRRFITFWLDFIMSIMMIGPILGILPAITEWKRTGTFKWYFERAAKAPGDEFLMIALTILVFFWLIFYYSFPLLRKRPTPGSCIMGYQVVPDEGVTITFNKAILRTLLGGLSLCVAYIAFIGHDRKNGKFWLDFVFRTRALKLE